MRLLKAYVQTDLARLGGRGCGSHSGPARGVAPDILDIIERAEARTAATTASICRWRSTMAGGPTSSMRRGKFARLVKAGWPSRTT
jgi:hypothetical protein